MGAGTGADKGESAFRYFDLIAMTFDCKQTSISKASLAFSNKPMYL